MASIVRWPAYTYRIQTYRLVDPRSEAECSTLSPTKKKISNVSKHYKINYESLQYVGLLLLFRSRVLLLVSGSTLPNVNCSLALPCQTSSNDPPTLADSQPQTQLLVHTLNTRKKGEQCNELVNPGNNRRLRSSLAF